MTIEDAVQDILQRPTTMNHRSKPVRGIDTNSALPGPPVGKDERLAELAWGLAHPLRVKILRLLVKRTTCMCGEIVETMPVAQSTVSQHLKILKEAGLIQGEIDGPRVCYCVVPETIERLKRLLAEF